MPVHHPRGFPQRLKFYCEEAGVSVTELARALDISTSAVYQWHTGGNISLTNLHKVAGVLGINARLLLDGPEAASSPAPGDKQDSEPSQGKADATKGDAA